MLENINYPYDLKKLNAKQLSGLAEEIREQIINIVNHSGGHLSSNLGTVELTLAIHRVFNAPTDKIIFDVGHQCYTHKIISGRKSGLISLRQTGGVSGFVNPSESEYDAIYAGHSGTSLSQALGMCRARDLKNQSHNVVAVIGDGSLGSGMALEALNDIGNSKTKIIIILNDNDMSIEKNVGAISRHLRKLRLNRSYISLKRGFNRFIFRIPIIGKAIKFVCDAIKRAILFFVSKSIFDKMGIKYSGPYDGHDIAALIKAFNSAKEYDSPLLLHIHTKKGKGYKPAEDNPELYHSINKGFLAGHSEFSQKSGDMLCKMAEKDDSIVAVTASMKDGTGLSGFAQKFPQRFYDVGICEQHAVTLCAGLAAGGCKPYFCVYSTFLQRAYDQISNDIALSKQPVTFIIDKAGLVGKDGETHHGIFDVAFLTGLPNMTIYMPKDLYDLESILNFSLSFNAPLAIRYGSGYYGEFDFHKELIYGKWEPLTKLCGINIIAYGNNMLHLAFKVRQLLFAENTEIGIINAAFIKPLDNMFINTLGGTAVILEESLPCGNLYSMICSYISTNNIALKAVSICLPDSYIGHGCNEYLLSKYDMSAEKIALKIKSL